MLGSAAKAVDVVASCTRPGSLTFSLFFFFSLPGELEAAVAVFSMMIDVTVSPSRFRKMSTSLAESTVECCLWFFCHSSFFLFFFFAEYCKTVCQVVVFVPAMLRLLLHTRTYMLIFYILFLLLMLLIIWMSVKNNTSTAPDWNSLQQRAAVSYLAVFI